MKKRDRLEKKRIARARRHFMLKAKRMGLPKYAKVIDETMRMDKK
jgi:hypothetical protein